MSETMQIFLVTSIAVPCLLWLLKQIEERRALHIRKRRDDDALDAAFQLKKVDDAALTRVQLWARIEKLEGRMEVLTAQNLQLSRDNGSLVARVDRHSRDYRALWEEKVESYNWCIKLQEALTANGIAIPLPPIVHSKSGAVVPPEPEPVVAPVTHEVP